MNIDDLRKLIQEVKLQEALQSGIKQVEHPFKAFFILGPAGSGKTFMKDAALKLPNSFVSVNTDEAIEKVFPKFGLTLKFAEGDVEKKQEVRKLLQQAVSDKTKRKINQALPILFDTTGENTDKMKTIMRSLVDIGYDVGVFMINVPPDFSVEADQSRPRTVGADLTRQISNNYQKEIVDQGAYAQMQGERGITILNPNPYPNIFDLRDGSLRPEFDQSMLSDDKLELKGGEEPESIRNPFKGASWEKAKGILEDSREKLQGWLSDRDPQNATGKEILKALEYVQDQGVADYGDQITDLVQYAIWADENEKELPKSVQNALQIIFDVEAFQQKLKKSVPSDKFPTSPQTVKTAQGDVEVPPELLPRFGQKGAPTIQQLTREQLMEIINWVKINS
jgi:predicted ABC-type ATPase